MPNMLRHTSMAFATVLAAVSALAQTPNPAQPDAKSTHAVGDLLWAGTLSTSSNAAVDAIAADASGNVYAAGQFSGTVDFDPGPATHVLTATGSYDDFVCKFDHSGALLWAINIPGTRNDNGIRSSLAVDAAGNVIIAGTFSGDVDFDPGPGVHTVSAVGISMYICKLSPDGVFNWAVNLPGYGNAITVDTEGAVYSVGAFSDTQDFDPGAGVYNLTSSNATQSMFISKLDANGHFVYARQFTGPGTPWPKSIAVDADGNVCAAGELRDGAIDFDPGAGVFNLAPTAIVDAFLVKLDASANFAWAKHFGGTANANSAYVAFDPTGNVYATGGFTGGTMDFDSGAGVLTLNAPGTATFISKLAPNGNHLWVKQIGASSYCAPYAIAVDNYGAIYTTGTFSGATNFDPGAGAYQLTAAVLDIFVNKLNSNGGFVYAKQVQGTSSASGFSIATDPSRNVYAGGRFSGTIDLDPGAAVSNVTAAGPTNGVIVALSGPSPIASDISGDDTVDAVDIQLVINKALGLPITGDADVNGDSQVDAVDVQTVINAALGIV